MRKLFSKKEKVYLFGDNEENRKIYQSKGDRDGVIFEEKTLKNRLFFTFIYMFISFFFTFCQWIGEHFGE